MAKAGKAKSDEYDIRAAVVRQLLAEGWKREDIRLEIPLDVNSSNGRADMVCLSDKLCCVELKSGKDKFCPDALREQTRSYRRAFDYVAIIADATHKRESEEKTGTGTRFLSNWRRVDLTYYHDLGFLGEDWREGPRRCENITKELFNYETCQTSTCDVARLLWACEASAVFGRKTTKGAFIKLAREEKTLKELRPLVIAQLRQRPANKWEIAFWKRFDSETLLPSPAEAAP